MPTKKMIGGPTTRSEGREKVSGAAIYATDVVLPNMLWAKALRSPIPYGRIKNIDTRKAEALPGVCAVATGEDVKRFVQELRQWSRSGHVCASRRGRD